VTRPIRPKSTETPTEGEAPPQEVAHAVIESMQRGQISALEEVFNLYGERVFGVCLGILGNRVDAEDASQEVFLRAFQQAARFSGRSRFSTWLLRLATNHTLNHAKAAKRRKRLSEPLLEDASSAGPAPDHGAIGGELREAIAELLQQIPLEQRQVLVLREMEGLSYAELAEVFAVPIGTVTSRLIRGREKLRALVLESGIDTRDLG